MAATVWSGHITFGLVSFPVELVAAARRIALDFDLLHGKDGSRVKYVSFCQLENRPLEKDEIVKGFAYEKGKYVILEPTDFAKAAPKTAKVMEMQEFVAASEVDPIALDASYYVSPREGGERPYALLFRALVANKLWGVAQMAMHNREHTVLLRAGKSGLILHTMFYQEELRTSEEFKVDPGHVKDKELALANMLVKSLEASFEPQKYHDAYRERLEAVIESKRKGKKVVALPETRLAPVVDIMDALRRSLAGKKQTPSKSAPARIGAKNSAKAVPATHSNKTGQRGSFV